MIGCFSPWDLNISSSRTKFFVPNLKLIVIKLFSSSYKFKAKPFDRRIVECDGMFGVKKPEETIEATKPKPFVFESDERLVARREKDPAENEVCSNTSIVSKH